MDQAQATRKKKKLLYLKGSEGITQYLLSAFGGVVLGAGTAMGQGLPLGACLVAAQIPGGRAVGTAIGAVVGYFLGCEPADAVEYTAVSLLMLLTLFLFQGTILPGKKWFMPLSCGLICGIMGSVRLFGSVEITVLPWLAKALLAVIGTYVFRKAMGGHRVGWVLMAGAMAFSLAGRGIYIDLGLTGALMIACISGELLPGSIMGMALDLSGKYSCPMTFILMLPGIACKLLGANRRWLKGILYGALPVATLFLFGEGELPQIPGCVLGAVMGLFFGISPILTPEVTTTEGRDKGRINEQAAEVLEALAMDLPNPPICVGTETEQIFDAVGDRLCRDCPRSRYCWGIEQQETYRDLSDAASEILKRGLARETDFSVRFRDRCRNFPEFHAAVNRELERILYRRRYYTVLRENRRILEQEYSLLAQFLRKSGQKPNTGKERRYTPLVGICSMRKEREKYCGDRGVSFLASDGSYYVLLCDGMGTGEEAAKLSSYAVRLLEKLLRTGLSPESAMALFNGNMTLRGSGTFSTVDLLRLDLHSGMAYLYKWGAAPSFWRDGERLCKIGTPTPPPGVGLGERGLPEKFKLSMKEKQFLILISDGAYCEETEDVMNAYRASSPRELAALLIGNMDGEDDRTAIVVTLDPRPA